MQINRDIANLKSSRPVKLCPDYDDYDDVYGRSVDDDTCISPTDASEFLYNRGQQQGNLGTFLVKEENKDDVDPVQSGQRRNSEVGLIFLGLTDLLSNVTQFLDIQNAIGHG